MGPVPKVQGQRLPIIHEDPENIGCKTPLRPQRVQRAKLYSHWPVPQTLNENGYPVLLAPNSGKTLRPGHQSSAVVAGYHDNLFHDRLLDFFYDASIVVGGVLLACIAEGLSDLR